VSQALANFIMVGFGLSTIVAVIFFCLYISVDNQLREHAERLVGLELEAGLIEPCDMPTPPRMRDWAIWHWLRLRQQTAPLVPPPPTKPEIPVVRPSTEPIQIPTEPSRIPHEVQATLLDKDRILWDLASRRPADVETVINRNPDRKPTPYKRPADHDPAPAPAPRPAPTSIVSKQFGEYTFRFVEPGDPADD
jgi:hypothetical protein